MNKFKIHTGIITLIIIMLINVNWSLSTDYFTLNDGSWNNTTNVWSIDGVNPCGCAPALTSSGDNISISNELTTSGNISITGGSTFLIESTGTLTGTNNLFIIDGFVSFYGDVSLAKLIVGSTGFFSLQSILTLSNRLEIKGDMLIDAGYVLMTSGNVDIYSTGSLVTTNAGKVDVNGGNIENYGIVDICASCCMTTQGNWKNWATVIGSGSATTTGGNMSNEDYFSPQITWCSVGFDTGMPTEEDCANANGTCSIVVLPVELSYFNVVNEESYISVVWETSTERNASHFEILKSFDGVNWINIGTVKAVGNSTTLSQYNFNDFDVNFTIAYYRLNQVDMDGTSELSDVKSVAGTAANELTFFPNPSSKHGNLNFVSSNTGSIKILSFNGQLIDELESVKGLNTISLGKYSLTAGVYFIIYSDGFNTIREKLLIID